jgi:hypothetical protein
VHPALRLSQGSSFARSPLSGVVAASICLPSDQRVCMACNTVYCIAVGLADHITVGDKGLDSCVLGKLLVDFGA